MALSKPVIGFNIGGITESVKNNESGYLCNPGEVKGMTGRIEELMKSKNKRLQMGREGRKRIENLYLAKDRTKDIEKEIINNLS